MAEVSAPELLGVIDVMQNILQRGREMQKRPAQGQLAASSDDPAKALEAVHGASILAVTPCRTFSIRTVDLLRHAGTKCLGDLASASHDRSIIRSSLRAELLRQVQRKHLEAQMAHRAALNMAIAEGTSSLHSIGDGGVSPTSVTASDHGLNSKTSKGQGGGGGARKVGKIRRGSTASQLAASGDGMGAGSLPGGPGAVDGSSSAKPRLPQLPSLAQPAPRPPPRVNPSASAPVLRHTTGAPRPRTPSVPLTSGGLGGDMRASSTSLLPPTTRTPGQLALARTLARAHNLDATLKRIDTAPTPAMLRSLSETFCAHEADSGASSDPSAGSQESRYLALSGSGSGVSNGATSSVEGARRLPHRPGQGAYDTMWTPSRVDLGGDREAGSSSGVKSSGRRPSGPSAAVLEMTDGDPSAFAQLEATLEDLMRQEPKTAKMTRFDST